MKLQFPSFFSFLFFVSISLALIFSVFVSADGTLTTVQLNEDGSAEYSFYSTAPSASLPANFSLEINAANSLSEITFHGSMDGLETGDTQAYALLSIQNNISGSEATKFRASLIYPAAYRLIFEDYAGLLMQINSRASGKDQLISAGFGFPKNLYLKNCEAECVYNCSSGCYAQADYFNCSSNCSSNCTPKCADDLHSFSKQIAEYQSNSSVLSSAEDSLNRAFAEALNESTKIETSARFRINSLAVQEGDQFLISANLTWANASDYFAQALRQDDFEAGLGFPSNSYSSQLRELFLGKRDKDYYSKVSFDLISFNFSTTEQGASASFDSLISAPPTPAAQLSYSSLFAELTLKDEKMELTGNMSGVRNLDTLLRLMSASELRSPVSLESLSAKIWMNENETAVSIDMNLSNHAKKQGDAWVFDLASLSAQNETQFDTSDLTVLLPKDSQILSSSDHFQRLEPKDGRPGLLLPAGKYPIEELKISYRLLGGISNSSTLPIIAVVLLASILAGIVFLRLFKRN
ncbi:Uncharacterised protein [Candidatus Gugararchaeum adminiculabundum]|nr:Uncharacterised protein [Candidatus Gugararchaeum adminiculabundum]